MGRVLNWFNNVATRCRRKRYRPEEVLLLFSSCLQRSACECNVRESLGNCRRCGQCVVGPMLRLADELGIRVFMATGGRLAAREARSPDVKAIVAVACCKELSEGLKAVFPKPVALLEIATPHGPCKDTQIDFDVVREAINRFLH